MAEPCHECIKGTIHAGQPKGTEETLHGLKTYITGNRTNSRATIVLYSDVFGLALPNNKLLADAYAAGDQYLVYLPDFFQGDPLPLSVADVLIPVDAAKQSTWAKYTGILASVPGFIMWMGRHKEAPTHKLCMDWLAALRRETPAGRKIGIVGTCWGGKYAVRAARKSCMIEVDGVRVPLVDAAVALHPSNLVFPGDVQGAVVPVSYGWGLEDTNTKIEQKGKVEAIYGAEKAEGGTVAVVEHIVYEPGRHGFAVRGNPDDPAERKILEDSLKQVLDWFGKWL